MTIKTISAILSGSGVHHPADSISNAELVVAFNAYADRYNANNADGIAAGTASAITHSSVEFIEKASGIKHRYVVDKTGLLNPDRLYPALRPRADNEQSLQAEICLPAVQQALAQAGLQGSDIDAVICACANYQRPYPAIAIEVQAALGAKGFGFDMNVACSSATFGVAQAIGQIASGMAQRVLVIGPEITSGHLEWRDRDCHFIFGDVGTAMIIESPASAAARGFAAGWAIEGTHLITQYSNNIRNNAGHLSSAEDRDPDARDQRFYQNGRGVFKEVCPMAAAHIEGHLAALGYTPQGVRRFWLHQANLNMNLLISKKLLGRDATPDEAPTILDEYANTGGAGSVIAFNHHSQDLQSGDVGVLCSFGAGYSIGSVVMRKV
jgi:beta-ketodecanoyl-[acyl-carrier-protein] synthase